MDKPDIENNFFDALMFIALGLIILAIFKIYGIL
jgi:hypothetical protein